MHGDETTLREAERYYITVSGNVGSHPPIDGSGGCIRVIIKIIADRQSVMEPRVVAGHFTVFGSLGKCQWAAQRYKIVVGGDEAHDARHVFFAGAPAMQA